MLCRAEVQILDQVVAVVEDDVVLSTELRERLQSIKDGVKARGLEQPPEDVLIRETLDALILESIQLQLGKRAGVRISDSMLASSMKKIDERFFYRFYPDKGFAIDKANVASQKSFSGLDIINFKKGNFEKKETRDSSKIIMRMALDFHLGSKTLNIRKYLTKN